MSEKELEQKIRRNATLFVENNNRQFDGRLDYSEKSLSALEKFIEKTIDKNPVVKTNLDLLNKYRDMLGSYLAEVIRKNLGGHYTIQQEGIFKDAVVIEDIGEIAMISPFNKVAKRLQRGKEDDLEFYYKVLKERRVNK